MYRVEINGSEVLMDLIGRMAAMTGAEYQTRLVLETESTRLASAVSVLLGEPVVVDPELDERTGLGWGLLGLNPEVREEKPAGGLAAWNLRALEDTDIVVTHMPANGKVNGKPAAEADGAKCRYCGKGIAKGRSMCQGAECQRKAKHEQDERYAEKRKEKTQARLAEKDYGKCEFCDNGRLPRSKICGDPECEKKLNQKHQLAYQARKAAKDAQAAPAAAQAEVARSEAPFPDVTATEPWYEVEYPEQTLRLTFQELAAQNKSRQIADGTRVRAQPSGRLYALHAGRLIPDGQGETGKAR